MGTQGFWETGAYWVTQEILRCRKLNLKIKYRRVSGHLHHLFYVKTRVNTLKGVSFSIHAID